MFSLGSLFQSLPLKLTAEQCEGRTFIVTGANSGLGLACSQRLVQLGAARVVMAVRNLDSGKAAKQSIDAAVPNHKTAILVWHVDYASHDSVRDFAKKVEAELDRVDGLVANAGVSMHHWQEAEGLESNLTVNVVSNMLLVVLLLPFMEKCAKRLEITPTVSVVGSMSGFYAHDALFKADMEDIFNDLNDQKKWEDTMVSRYSVSKLILHFAARELAFRKPVDHSRVIINIVNPGLCKTNLLRDASAMLRFNLSIAKLIAGRSSEEGSRTLLHGVAAGEESHGKYLSECEIKEDSVPDWIKSGEGPTWQTAIWEQLAQRLEEIQPGCVTQALSV
ncbi:unnamed protein product [Clonostachys byssicola]|uniref:Uncharacterized protein n=1 Tax=Clonostachys byssicola TaxID=160290 RepID=A0A9N9U2G3_9HYPO|nr:unnamed protein product [Clonostachys byssicola]